MLSRRPDLIEQATALVITSRRRALAITYK